MSMKRQAMSVVLATVALSFAAWPAVAKIVAEGKLSQYCGEEAAVKLGVSVAELILLPVEKTKGQFFVYGQTDEPSPTLFSCTFDGKRKFLGIDVQGDAAQAPAPDSGAPKAAMDKCLEMFGAPAKLGTVSDFGNGHYEIIMQSKSNGRKVACTVPAYGSAIDDWVEMN